MRRREVIAGLGVIALGRPDLALGQKLPVVGYINPGFPETQSIFVPDFRQGLQAGGYVEGQNLRVEYRWARGRREELTRLIAELVSIPVDVLVCTGGTEFEAKSATSTIPIVMSTGRDPVAAGLIAAFNRPGGNITGIAMFTYSLGAKRLELLREVVPTARTIGVLVNPGQTSPETIPDREQVEAAGRASGTQLVMQPARQDSDFEPAIAAMKQAGAQALLVMADPYFANRIDMLTSVAEKYELPAIYEWREFVTAGGLMSYGASRRAIRRQQGMFAAKILKGAVPAELPVEQATKVELAINLKTAEKLGVTFPLSLLGRADEVIE
jgi:putative tryptophan/tyrosine transport system substrate-binding protein